MGSGASYLCLPATCLESGPILFLHAIVQEEDGEGVPFLDEVTASTTASSNGCRRNSGSPACAAWLPEKVVAAVAVLDSLEGGK